MVLKQVLSCVNKMQRSHLQGSWDCLGETGKQWWDGERMMDRKNCPGAGHHSVLIGYSPGVQVNQ